MAVVTVTRRLQFNAAHRAADRLLGGGAAIG
jgi:hypothetical protein